VSAAPQPATMAVTEPSQPAYAVPEPTYYLSRPMYRHPVTTALVVPHLSPLVP
jgi:hypothetical protein